MFYLNKKIDQGDIIDQFPIKINKQDYINDILIKVDQATLKLFQKNFNKILKNKNKRTKQNEFFATYRKLRGVDNSMINWNSKSLFIYNKIRAISKPYPGAIAYIGKDKYVIWKAQILPFNKEINSFSVGQFEIKKNYILIKCIDKIIKITKYEKI